MSTPIVPQRPVRSQNTTANASAELEIPQVPPRPSRTVERSRSPNRLGATRSPLNDSPFAYNIPPGPGEFRPAPMLTKAPSVASLPLIGQEGMEYASLEQQQTQNAAGSVNRPESPNETRNIAGDLPMHAPQATVSPSAATAQLAPVTRVDSAQAASSGIGKTHTEYEDTDLHPSRTREFRPPSASSRDLTRSTSRPNSSRPESFHSDEHDHGIPHIGLQAPLYPNAGDVQAPFPGSGQAAPSTGIGFFNAGVQTSSSPHGRRRSFQGGPPGSYGLHGHGVIHNDQFEKSWYQKHPEELSKEEKGAYGPGINAIRSEWALSSDDLNKLVRESAHKQLYGTAPPDEDFGYKLSEEKSRQNSPQLRAVKSRSLSQTYAESPLRQASFPDDVHGAHAFDSENEDDHLHLDHPRESGTLALASDELVKSPSAPGMQPAVSPYIEKSGDDSYFPSANLSPTQSRSGRSRPNSRPGSARFHHHDLEGHGTHLDDVEEYEPLFNEEDEEDDNKLTKPLTHADKLKRPELDRRRFPSRDIWEDTPTSLQLHTTVSGPQEPDEPATESSRAAPAFETPEQEQARRAEATEAARPHPLHQSSYLDDERNKWAKSKFNSGVEDETSYRSGIARKFPSRDIWEDTPTSLQLVTSIDEAKAREQEAAAAPAGQEKPSVPARPTRSKAVEATQTQPSVPPRPQKAKPQVPPRPIKTSSQDDNGEGSTLTKTTSASSSGSPEVTSPTDRSITGSKPRPAIPSKPAGSSKFATIKAGFMNDLNSRLQQGPQVKKPSQLENEVSQEEEKAPLSDARKARAKGPVRRKPAEPSPTERSAPTSSSSTSWSIVSPMNTWSISNIESDQVIVGAPASRGKPNDSTRQEAPSEPAPEEVAGTADDTLQTQEEPATEETPAPQAETSTKEEQPPKAHVLATNTAGEPVLVPAVEPPEDTAEQQKEKDARAAAREQAAAEKLRPHFERQFSGAEGDQAEGGVAIEQMLPEASQQSDT